MLILSADATKFLVCQKYKQNVTAEYIMPGGKNDEHDDMLCLKNEIHQELQCSIDFSTLTYIGTYSDVAAGFSDRDVEIKLVQGEIIGEPRPSTEIEKLHWIGREHLENGSISSVVRTKIMPDIIARNILK